MHFVHIADDTTVFASDSHINNVHATVNRELVGVDNWLKANRLSLNILLRPVNQAICIFIIVPIVFCNLVSIKCIIVLLIFP